MYFIPKRIREKESYNENGIRRIILLKMLFDEAYKNGIFIFILTNNTYKSLLLKEIMDAALDINFPLEHILRGGSGETWTIWEDGMIKYNVLKYTNSDIYKCLGKDGYKKGLDKIIPAYQYDID